MVKTIMNQIIVYFGVALLMVTVILSGYALLLRKIDVKRLVVFATIGFFSGTILLLSERITTIRLPVLGEIVTKAREDAMEINQIREKVENQRKVVSAVVEQAKNLQQEMEQLRTNLHLQKRIAREKYLQERIDELNKEISESEQREINKTLSGAYDNTLATQREMIDAKMRIFRLRDLVKKYSEELDSLEKEESAQKNSHLKDK
jgi:hypothetical protein